MANAAVATIGHNAPPVEQHGLHINDLYDEAKNFLDGAPIASQADAEAVAKILVQFREARKGADEQRKIEKQPHDLAAAKVQEAWNPLIAKCERAERIAKNAIGSWQTKLEAEQRAAAAEAARKAEEERLAAQAMLEASRGSERLEDAEEAEAALKRANAAEREAGRADKAKPLVASGGRSIGLRSVWTAELSDSAAALKHYRERQPEALKAWLAEQAQRDVRAGVRAIPGFTISESKVAV